MLRKSDFCERQALADLFTKELNKKKVVKSAKTYTYSF